MDSNFWFFTLSTISQTLAAIIALASTFVVYKLTRINYQLHTLTQEVKALFVYELQEDDNPHDLIGTKYREVLAWFSGWLHKLDLKKYKEGSPEYIDFVAHLSDIIDISPSLIMNHPEHFKRLLKEKEDYFIRLLNDKESSYKYLKNSLIFTATTIALSLIAIPFYPFFQSLFIPNTIIGVLVLFAVCSTVYTSVIVWKITRL